jgi:L-serine dehydratase
MHSLFDLFKIGIGPSSSHTVGPMLAALEFSAEIQSANLLDSIAAVRVQLFGSLALTGRGHATDSAIIGGLCGKHPRTVALDDLADLVEQANDRHLLQLGNTRSIPFNPRTDIEFCGTVFLPHHPNGLTLRAFDAQNQCLLEQTYYSIGGGFIVNDADVHSATEPILQETEQCVPYDFKSAKTLLSLCNEHGLAIAELVNANELSWRNQAAVDAGIDEIWAAMKSSIELGCQHSGILPGGLNVRRRARMIYEKLLLQCDADQMVQNDWVSLFALAVNEENAAGGRVVTAPTNGAAGVIPAVIAYVEKFLHGDASTIRTFLKTATAIGLLYKMNASLSAAEMGCQGEVGVACSMAAGGLAATMGGTNGQIENAAEIGMEHNLGLTCDPISGLVQVPCIERNTMGAIKAINAARLAVLYGDGEHRVSLDGVIETMRQTGVDMQSKYKETSQGGLAVNVTEC